MDTVLITGASTGIGLALSRLVISEGRDRLVLTARRDSLGRLREAGIEEGESVAIRALDVTVAKDRQRLVEECEDAWGGVSVLVNNAGVAYRSVVEHFETPAVEDQLAINFLGPMALVRLVLPGMRRRRSGRIVNVSSVGGMMAMPTMSLYSASKFALEGATEALWYEVRPWGIHVTLVQPGFIRSSSFQKTRYTPGSRASMDDPNDVYHRHYEHMACFIETWMNRALSTPEGVARRIRRIMRASRPPLRAAGTPDAFLFSVIRRVVPRRWYHWILYRSLPSVQTWGR